jgi:hypothetical protein
MGLTVAKANLARFGEAFSDLVTLWKTAKIVVDSNQSWLYQ